MSGGVLECWRVGVPERWSDLFFCGLYESGQYEVGGVVYRTGPPRPVYKCVKIVSLSESEISHIRVLPGIRPESAPWQKSNTPSRIWSSCRGS